jgi:hypothetical protein
VGKLEIQAKKFGSAWKQVNRLSVTSSKSAERHVFSTFINFYSLRWTFSHDKSRANHQRFLRWVSEIGFWDLYYPSYDLLLLFFFTNKYIEKLKRWMTCINYLLLK